MTRVTTREPEKIPHTPHSSEESGGEVKRSSGYSHIRPSGDVGMGYRSRNRNRVSVIITITRNVTVNITMIMIRIKGRTDQPGGVGNQPGENNRDTVIQAVQKGKEIRFSHLHLFPRVRGHSHDLL